MYRYDPRNSPFRMLRYLPRLPARAESKVKRLVRRCVDGRKIIRGYYDLYDIPLQFLGYFDVPQRSDPYLPGGGGVPTLFDELERRGIPYRLWDYRTPESRSLDELLDSIGKDRRFLFLYTAELDALMHRAGVLHADVGAKLRQYEKAIGALVQKSRRSGEDVLMYVFSDHGMTDVRNTIDVEGAIEQCGVRLGRDYMAFFDATMARFWVSGIARDAIIGVLDEIEGGRILADRELQALGCLFEDRSYGELIFAADPGTMIVPSFMGRERMAAMHGYDPNDASSKACLFTNDPACPLPHSIMEFKQLLLDAAGRSG
ncbi:MAG: alkaline phosphatase family protein [Chitinivibrionia bacterium]|nr:alkaline phosphatase family protein [Chitinivibrionia bacterium]